jgi:hypothetical protein
MGVSGELPNSVGAVKVAGGADAFAGYRRVNAATDDTETSCSRKQKPR